MRATLFFLIACLLAALMPFTVSSGGSATIAAFPGWPAQLEGKPLRKLPRSAREQRFERDFPGRIARFSAGEREVILRWVTRETRTLHPAADCFKGLGYAIEPQPLYRDSEGRHWGAFIARKGAERLDVREIIHDDAGRSWSDISAWYWAALCRHTDGPWWAITIAEKPVAH